MVLGRKKFCGPVQRPSKSGRRKNSGASKSGFFYFELKFGPWNHGLHPKWYFHHIDIGLSFHLQKNWVNWSKNHRAMTIFVREQRNSWKSSFRPDWLFVENFNLGPRAQFLANQPNSFFLDHIDTRSLGGNHHWVSRGTAGRELRSGQIPPPPALNKLDQRPLYIGLTSIQFRPENKSYLS